MLLALPLGLAWAQFLVGKRLELIKFQTDGSSERATSKAPASVAGTNARACVAGTMLRMLESAVAPSICGLWRPGLVIRQQHKIERKNAIVT